MLLTLLAAAARAVITPDQVGGSVANGGESTVTQYNWPTTSGKAKPAVGSKVVGYFTCYNLPGTVTVTDDVGNIYRVATGTDNGTTYATIVEGDIAVPPAYLRVTTGNGVYGTLQPASFFGVKPGALDQPAYHSEGSSPGSSNFTVGPSDDLASGGELIFSGFSVSNGSNPALITGPLSPAGTLVGLEDDAASFMAARSAWRVAAAPTAVSDTYNLGSVNGGLVNAALATFEAALLINTSAAQTLGALTQTATAVALAPTTFYELAMAQGPVNYWRNGETSGTTMVDEVAEDGVYIGAVSQGNPALYPGTGALTSTSFGYGVSGASSVFPASLAAMTLITIIRPTDLTGIKLLGVQRDENAAGRKWQWRSNGDAIEFVKIVGGVAVISVPAMLAINTTYLLAIEIDVAGNYTVYRNGVSVQTGTIAAGDYGGAGDTYRIGYAVGPDSIPAGPISENVVFDKALGPTVQAALFDATELGAPATRSASATQTLGGLTSTATSAARTSVPGGASVAGDPNFASVTLLCHMDSLGSGAGGALVDVKGHALTATAGATNLVLSTSVKKYGTGSVSWPTANEYVNVAASPDWIMPGDFTVECWAYWDQNDTAMALFNLPGEWDVYRTGTGSLRLYHGTDVIATAASTVALNTFHHVALVRFGSTITLWLNGAAVGTYSFSGDVGANSAWTIGAFSSASDGMRGYIDDFRITNGVARYTSTFTPPAAAFPDVANSAPVLGQTLGSLTQVATASGTVLPTRMIPGAAATGDPLLSNVQLLLHFDGTNGSTTFTDSSPIGRSVSASSGAIVSTAQSVFGGASMRNNADGSWAVVADLTGLSFGTGDFSLQCRYYPPPSGQFGVIARTDGGHTGRWYMAIYPGTNNIYVQFNGADAILTTASVLTPEAWQDIEWSRTAGVSKMFVNGVEVYSGADTRDYQAGSSGFMIGGGFGLSANQYIDEVRLTVGAARHAADFTPATEAFPGAPAAAYFDPAFKASSMALSNSDKTVTKTSGGGSWALARGLSNQSSGKRYIEFLNQTNVLYATDVGLVTSAATTSSQINGASYGYYINDDPATLLGPSPVPISPDGTVPQGDYSMFAVDFDTGMVWAGRKGYGWFGGGDPAAGTSPSFNTVVGPGLSLWPAVSIYFTGAAVTMRTATTDMEGTIPTGFAAWDAAVPVAPVLGQTLAPLTQSATASGATGGASASAAQTLATVSQAATATVRASAAVAQTLASVAQTATVTHGTLSAAAVQILAGISQSAALTVAARAVAAQVLDSVIQSAAASGPALAGIVASQILGGVVQTATVTGTVKASAAQVLLGVSQTAAVAALAKLAAVQTLDGITQAVFVSHGQLSATATQTLAPIAQAVALLNLKSATAAQTLAGVTQTATARLLISLYATQVLDAVLQSAMTKHDTIIELDARTLPVYAENRELPVYAENRALVVVAEQRELAVIAENRYLE